MTSWPSITKCNQLVLGIRVIRLIHASLWDQKCWYPCFAPGGAALSIRDETDVGYISVNFKWYQHKRKKKKKELNIWSMAEVFSVAALHFPQYHAHLHQLQDVNHACGAWMWRHSITGLDGSSEVACPGSCKTFTLIKLVYSINFPIFS